MNAQRMFLQACAQGDCVRVNSVLHANPSWLWHKHTKKIFSLGSVHYYNNSFELGFGLACSNARIETVRLLTQHAYDPEHTAKCHYAATVQALYKDAFNMHLGAYHTPLVLNPQVTTAVLERLTGAQFEELLTSIAQEFSAFPQQTRCSEHFQACWNTVQQQRLLGHVATTTVQQRKKM